MSLFSTSIMLMGKCWRAFWYNRCVQLDQKGDLDSHMLEAIYLIRHAMPDRGASLPYNVLPGPPLKPRLQPRS